MIDPDSDIVIFAAMATVGGIPHICCSLPGLCGVVVYNSHNVLSQLPGSAFF